MTLIGLKHPAPFYYFLLPFHPFHPPIGAAPKKDGTIRLILDLYSPRGTSVNHDIPVEFFTVKYSSMVQSKLLILLVSCFMAKVDIKHAFRLLPGHFPLLANWSPGQIFLRGLIDLSTIVAKLHHHIDLTIELRKDLIMWNEFLSSWNETSAIQHAPVVSPSLTLFTDASFLGLVLMPHFWDLEAYSTTNGFLFVSSLNIAYLEFFAVYAVYVSVVHYRFTL